MQVTMGGIPMGLLGKEVKVGDKAPLFKAVNVDLSEFRLEDHLGKAIVLTCFPSVDTGICAVQAAKFNNEVGKLGDKALVVTVSNDLPFALTRYCAAEGVENAITVSDHKDLDFSMQYGMLIGDLRLLARAVFVIDQEGVIRYKELASEVKSELNYEKALEALKELI